MFRGYSPLKSGLFWAEFTINTRFFPLRPTVAIVSLLWQGREEEKGDVCMGHTLSLTELPPRETTIDEIDLGDPNFTHLSCDLVGLFVLDTGLRLKPGVLRQYQGGSERVWIRPSAGPWCTSCAKNRKNSFFRRFTVFM